MNESISFYFTKSEAPPAYFSQNDQALGGHACGLKKRCSAPYYSAACGKCSTAYGLSPFFLLKELIKSYQKGISWWQRNTFSQEVCGQTSVDNFRQLAKSNLLWLVYGTVATSYDVFFISGHPLTIPARFFVCFFGMSKINLFYMLGFSGYIVLEFLEIIRLQIIHVFCFLIRWCGKYETRLGGTQNWFGFRLNKVYPAFYFYFECLFFCKECCRVETVL